MIAPLPGIASLNDRRLRLGMSFRALAARSGVSQPTLKRVLGGAHDASMSTLLAIARALGVEVRLEEEDIGQMKGREARRKAEWVARQVQGTSGLEAQAVDERTRRELIERTVHELLAGPARRLWDD
jgi:transcriptional regulator with XRE-family HTH domain